MRSSRTGGTTADRRNSRLTCCFAGPAAIILLRLYPVIPGPLRVSADNAPTVLQLATASSTILAVLAEAVQADEILTKIGGEVPALHPLALVVPNRLLTELLAWPMTGTPPRQLSGTRAPRSRVGGAGPARCRSPIGRGSVADRADRGIEGAMLRRQAQYLVAEHRASAEWVAEMRAHDVRAGRDIREWSPEWAVTRSRAISAAAGGDLDPLMRFIEHGLGTEQAVRANLPTGRTGSARSRIRGPATPICSRTASPGPGNYC
ncbi:hypothetical protein [Saccharopolyspora sp. CA-218241]|uniref:hypothetical protein n=1 Tax=Saccharopolyspora sp. CA-218241 TaxID=3240027 RepID=UPI003D956B75